MSVITATTTTTSNAPARSSAPAPPSVQTTITAPLRRAWEDYVRRAPAGTLFHLPQWCAAVEAVFPHRPKHQLAIRHGAVVGVLPLYEIRSFLAGTLLVSVPYAVYGGIVAEDDATRTALAAEARRLTDQCGARALEFRSETAVCPDLPLDERYVCFVRDLPVDLKELETFLPRKARAAARQARQREGLTVAHESDQLALTWNLYARSMRRLASINYPRRFFDELVNRFGDDAWITIVRRGTQPVAGLLSFVFRDTIYPYFVGVDERARCTGAMNLLYLAVMERAVQEGLRRFDFGRSRKDNAGSYRFKEHQGFVPRTLGYQRYLPAGCEPPDLSPSNPRWSLARRIWPRLPLGLTKPLGAWLSRAIPG